jgi:hypothetical protein
MPSPRKSRHKRKVLEDLDHAPPAGRAKKTRAPKSIEAADSQPTAPLGELDGRRRSGRSNAGTGGRSSQLEKLDVVLEGSSRKPSLKGSTSLGADVPRNPQAPDSHKTRKTRKVRRHNQMLFEA